jgi:cell division protein FtsX
MDPDRQRDLSHQVEGLVERHGDEVADEMVKTSRFVRRFSIGVMVLVVIGFVAFIVFAFAIFSKF